MKKRKDKIKKACIALVVCSLCMNSYAREATAKKPIDRVQSINNGYTFFYNASGWGAAGCSSAQYARLDPNKPASFGDKQHYNFKEIFTIALTARASNESVYFQGICNGNNHFLIDSIGY